MKPLPTRSYEQILDLVMAALDEPAPGSNPWSSLATAVRDTVGATATLMLTEERTVDPVLAWTRSPSVVRANERVRRFRALHPLTPVFAAGEKSPTRVSDVVGAGEWRRNPAYDLCLREVDSSVHHVGIPLASRRTILVCRARRDFTRLDLDLIDRMLPLLVRLDRHTCELAALRAETRSPAGAEAPAVTPRELTVLALMAEGLTAAAIGRRLGIRTVTVSKHQENLYRKLGANDRLTAVLVAQRHGLVPAPRRPA